MAGEKAASDAKDATPSGPPRVKAPPKTSPPADAKADEGGDAKDADAGAKKKALPPPSTAPPQGTTSAAAAFRAKSTLPPPNGPPPTGTAPSASVAKIRGAARPPSAGPPPGGAALAKPVGAPPSTKPPTKAPIGAPPTSAPPPKAEAKPADEAQGDSKAADVKKAPVPVPATAPPAMAKATPEAKKAPMRAPSLSDGAGAGGEAKTPRPSTPSGGGGAKAAPVDILGDNSPIFSANTPPVELSVPLSAKVPKQAPKMPPSQARSQTSSTTTAPSSSSAAAASASDVAFKPAIVKKSTMEVLNDTTASLSLRSRNIDEHLAKTAAAAAAQNAASDSGTTGGAALSSTPITTTKVGHAVPFSGSSRPNVPEEEIITVKKQEPKKSELESEDSAAVDGKAAPGGAQGDAKSAKSGSLSSSQNHHHQIHFDDSLDDVEEIPFLEEVKPEPKLMEKMEAKKSAEASEDDPIIEIENKHAAPKPVGANRATSNSSPSPQQGDAKDHQDHKSSNNNNNNNNYYEDKADDDALLSTRRESSHEDIYDEFRKLKRSSPRLDGDGDGDNEDDGTSSTSDPRHASSGSNSSSSHHRHGRRESVDEGDAKDTSSSSSREKAREKRKEKRRSKVDDEPKKIQAQFFNPKSVPYVPDHLLDFAKRPLECGRGHIMKCFIERNDSGPNKLSPIYTLLLEVNSSSGRPIMYAREKAASRITSHYVISMNKDDLFLSRMMRSHQYIGKLRSSTSMLEYCLYDQGDNPEDLDSDCEVDDELRKSIRAELAVIRYHNSKKSYARKMEVVIPTIVENGSAYLDWRPISRDQMMEEHVRAITAAGGQNVLDTSNFVFMHKRETKYDPLSSCIVDFRSRATCVSVKNFQLVHSEPTNEQMREKYRKLHPEYVYEDQGTVSLPQEHVLLQLGKVGKDCFNMDFQYPLSMLQAFAISLSRFDTKQRSAAHSAPFAIRQFARQSSRAQERRRRSARMNNSKGAVVNGASLQEKTPLLLKRESSDPRIRVPPSIEAEVDIKAEFLALLSMALQVSLSTFARLALTSVDFAFLGHLGTTELAAASLSSVWTGLPLMTIWGACGALTTLCGQAWGAKNGELMGVWLQMGLAVVTVLTTPVFIGYWFVGYALEMSTDDQEVIRLGIRFARIMSFAAWPAVAYVCIRLYFQAMGIMAPTTVVGAVSIGVAIGANYFLIYGCFGWSGMGFDGSPLATVIATWFQPIALVSYCVLYKKMHLAAWGGWDFSAFTSDRIKTYANLAIPIAINSLIANLASSALSLIAAKLGSDVIAANAVITGLWRLLWALFWGFGCATQIRVANCLGANRPNAAKALSKLGFICTVVCVVLLAIVTLAMREQIFKLYTTDDALLKLCMLVQPIFITGFMIESIEMLAASVLNAMGEAKVVAWTATLSTWFIELPIAYIGGVTLGYGFPALWYSICIMEVIKLTVYLIKLSRTDWNRMAKNAVENMEVAQETEVELEEDAFKFAMAEGGNAPLGYNTAPLSPLTPVPTPSSVVSSKQQKQWGEDVEDGLPIKRSRLSGSTGGQ